MDEGTYRRIGEADFRAMAARILYEDNHLLVIDKQAGEIVQGDKTGDEPLAEAYKAFLAQRDGKKGNVFLGIPHRLDRPVSGITVLAKTSKALERMTKLFREGGVRKTYWALVCQPPREASARLEDRLWRDEKRNKTYVCRPGSLRPEAKEARLAYRLIGRTERYWLLEVELFTGRHHQIRCQLAHIGCPIKGDLKYGAPRSNPDGSISLHARNIRFTHPVRQTEINLTAPLPPTWKGVPDPLSANGGNPGNPGTIRSDSGS